MCVRVGDGEDYLALTLRDGAVTLNTNLGSGKLDVQIRPPRVRFDDNQWHRVNIHRKAQEVLANSRTLYTRNSPIPIPNDKIDLMFLSIFIFLSS